MKVGAHPSLPDLQGFGRREMKMGREEMANCLIYQIGALCGFLRAEGMELNHIKQVNNVEMDPKTAHLRLAMAALQEKEAVRNSLAE